MSRIAEPCMPADALLTGSLSWTTLLSILTKILPAIEDAQKPIAQEFFPLPPGDNGAFESLFPLPEKATPGSA